MMQAFVQEYKAKNPQVTWKQFQTDIKNAWNTCVPEEGATKTKSDNDYWKFLSEKMQELKAAHPNMTHQERMQEISKMWSQHKNEHPESATKSKASVSSGTATATASTPGGATTKKTATKRTKKQVDAPKQLEKEPYPSENECV